MASLKEQKQLFVSDLSGGSIGEIYYVTGVSITAWLSFSLIKRGLGGTVEDVPLVYDFFLNCVTLLAAITIYSARIAWLHWMIILPGVFIFFGGKLGWWPKGEVSPKPTPKTSQFLPKKSFITAYRAHMLVITNVAILAVDFRVFPRRFAKVETWGTSLMDLGVGSFVFSMGLVHSRSVIKAQTTQKARFNWSSYIQIIVKGIQKSIPLLILGLVRLVSVKGLDYHEHVTEYGIHWNFFLTLGFLPTLLAILDPALVFFPRALVAFCITAGHEILLHRYDLIKYVLTESNRLDNLLSMNKEGICSFLGYLSIFIFGQSFGSFVLTAKPTPCNLVQIPNGTQKPRNSSFFQSWLTVSTTRGLLVSSIFYQALFYYVSTSPGFSNISRRLGNMPYVLWVVSYNAGFLLAYNTVEQLVPHTESYLLNATNNNGLGLFLLANLGTGLVNMGINTLAVSDATAFAILLAYGAAVCGIAVECEKRKIYFKL